MTHARTLLVGCNIALALATTAHAQAPSHGHDFVTIGAPGNRNTIPKEVPLDPTISQGKVDYVYRMTRTEITVAQWNEFLNAFEPFAPDPRDPDLLGRYLFRNTGGGGYTPWPGTEQYPTNMSWRYAARYANWLHNGKASNAAAFESGAYDTSTFTQNPNGSYNDQRSRSPGARFWIPSLDEWIKATYYDPNRYGPGEEGYWRSPGSQQDPLLSGYPLKGGETNAGLTNTPIPPGMDAGSYPHITSPWGLLDTSGGESEWTETPDLFRTELRQRYTMGSSFGGTQFPDFLDIPWLKLGPEFSAPGLRIASVPAPGVPAAVFVSCVMMRRRIR